MSSPLSHRAGAVNDTHAHTPGPRSAITCARRVCANGLLSMAAAVAVAAHNPTKRTQKMCHTRSRAHRPKWLNVTTKLRSVQINRAHDTITTTSHRISSFSPRRLPAPASPNNNVQINSLVYLCNMQTHFSHPRARVYVAKCLMLSLPGGVRRHPIAPELCGTSVSRRVGNSATCRRRRRRERA